MGRYASEAACGGPARSSRPATSGWRTSSRMHRRRSIRRHVSRCSPCTTSGWVRGGSCARRCGRAATCSCTRESSSKVWRSPAARRAWCRTSRFVSSTSTASRRQSRACGPSIARSSCTAARRSEQASTTTSPAWTSPRCDSSSTVRTSRRSRPLWLLTQASFRSRTWRRERTPPRSRFGIGPARPRKRAGASRSTSRRRPSSSWHRPNDSSFASRASSFTAWRTTTWSWRRCSSTA